MTKSNHFHYRKAKKLGIIKRLTFFWILNFLFFFLIFFLLKKNRPFCKKILKRLNNGALNCKNKMASYWINWIIWPKTILRKGNNFISKNKLRWKIIKFSGNTEAEGESGLETVVKYLRREKVILFCYLF